MWARVLSGAVAVVCLALAATACGRDGSGESSDGSAAVIEQIDRICADWKDAVDERGDFPLEDFDAENPSADDLPAVGEYFASGESAAEEAIADVRELSAPADVEAEVDALVTALEQQLESAKVQAAAARGSDVAAFTATLEDASSSQEDVQDAADDLGAEGCAF
jgi:hypothetical protein